MSTLQAVKSVLIIYIILFVANNLTVRNTFLWQYYRELVVPLMSTFVPKHMRIIILILLYINGSCFENNRYIFSLEIILRNYKNSIMGKTFRISYLPLAVHVATILLKVIAYITEI